MYVSLRPLNELGRPIHEHAEMREEGLEANLNPLKSHSGLAFGG